MSTRSFTGASASNINVSDIRDDWADAYQCYGNGANVAKVADAFDGDNVQTIIGATFEDGYPNVVERQSMEQYRAAEQLRMSEPRIVAQQLEWEKHMMAQAEAINAAKKKVDEIKPTEEKKVYEAPKVEVKEVVDEKPAETVVEKSTEVVEEVAKEPTPTLKKEEVVETIPNEVETPKVEPKVETKVEETVEKVADDTEVKVEAVAIKEKKAETPKKEVAAKPKAVATKKTETKTAAKKTATKSTSKKSSAAKK